MLLNRADVEEFKIDYPIMTTPELQTKYRAIRRDINQLAKRLGVYRSKKGTGKLIKI